MQLPLTVNLSRPFRGSWGSMSNAELMRMIGKFEKLLAAAQRELSIRSLLHE